MRRRREKIKIDVRTRRENSRNDKMDEGKL